MDSLPESVHESAMESDTENVTKKTKGDSLFKLIPVKKRNQESLIDYVQRFKKLVRQHQRETSQDKTLTEFKVADLKRKFLKGIAGQSQRREICRANAQTATLKDIYEYVVEYWRDEAGDSEDSSSPEPESGSKSEEEPQPKPKAKARKVKADKPSAMDELLKRLDSQSSAYDSLVEQFKGLNVFVSQKLQEVQAIQDDGVRRKRGPCYNCGVVGYDARDCAKRCKTCGGTELPQGHPFFRCPKFTSSSNKAAHSTYLLTMQEEDLADDESSVAEPSYASKRRNEVALSDPPVSVAKRTKVADLMRMSANLDGHLNRGRAQAQQETALQEQQRQEGASRDQLPRWSTWTT